LPRDAGASDLELTGPAPEAGVRARAIPSWLPGIGLVLAIAIAARLLARFTAPVPDVVLALLAGLIVRNLMRPAEIQKGVSFTLFYGLRTAIIFLGAGISVQALVRTGATTVGLIVALVVISFGLGLLFARIFRLDPTIGTLIGAGTAICGGSAILAIAPLVRAKSEEVAYSITTIFGFNIVALIVYPILGHWLGMSQTRFGSWVGTAVNDTSVVVATGYVFGTGAGSVATIVKLTRTALLVPLAVVVGFMYAQRGGVSPKQILRTAGRSVPWFIVGFIAVAALNSFGVLAPELAKSLTLTASFLIVAVLAAVGLNADLAKMLRLGLKPMLVGFLLATIMAVTSYSLILWLGIG
jgi:uncharacterized integral membrane protein (TIGR00698 family)